MPGPGVSSGRHRTRQQRRGHMDEPTNSQPATNDDDAVVVESTSPTCIDLTSDMSAEEIIDLTRSHGIMDSHVVLLTPTNDPGPIRRRRGSGRLGQRRSRRRIRGGLVRTRSGLGDDSTLEMVAAPVQVDDSDSDELPDIPFEVPPPNAASLSILQSPEGVKISCPVCMDDLKQIKRNHRQMMSTICGHLFCNECITTAINRQKACPTCRKKLTVRNVHPVFL